MAKHAPNLLGVRIPKADRKSAPETVEQTRQQIIQGLLQSIAEVGLHNTSSAEISKRTGLTWGAVVYHFGDKHGLLLAAFEQGYKILLNNLQSIPAAEVPLQERIDRFIECAWSGLCNPHLRAYMEIQIGYLPVRESSEWQEQSEREWFAEWSRIFSDAYLDRAELAKLAAFTRATLTGITVMSEFHQGETQSMKASIDILRDTLTARMAAASPPTAKLKAKCGA